MSSPWVQPAPEIGKLRTLVALDRTDAGEARPIQRAGPLTTVAYTKPLRVRLKRRWRSDQSLRRATWLSASFTVALVALALVALGQAPALRRADVKADTATRVAPAEPVGPAGFALLQARSAPPVHGPPPAPAVASGPVLSPRLRLQRADLWLRVGSERGAREARDLLESALRELPDSAHGQAALAEACLRLSDHACARAAVSAARALRPWRGGYRTLASKIDTAVRRPNSMAAE